MSITVSRGANMDRSLQSLPQTQALESRRLFSTVAPVIAPTNVVATALTPRNTALITYSDNSTNERSFYIYRSDDGGATYTRIAITNPGIERYTDATLMPDTTYFYLVRAHAATANSAYSNQATATTPDVTADNFAQLNGTTLTLLGTPEDDTLTFDVAAGIYTATLNGDALTFTTAQVRQLNIYMQDGNDTVTAGPSTLGAYINGGAGNDTILGGGHGDRIEGGDGNDLLKGRDGNDTITGGTGNDRIYGQAGSDSLNGSEGNDTLLGGDKRDTLVGGPGVDRLYGEGGIDTLIGDASDLLVQEYAVI